MTYQYKSLVLEELGVRTWINARNFSTGIGGTYLPAEVVDAMNDVGSAFCDMTELMDKASARLATLAEVEGAYITSGAAAGIVLSVAACITGRDTRKMRQLFGELEGREGLKRELVMQAVQSSPYDYQYLQAGGRLIKVGYPFGVTSTMIEDAINEKTAALVYVHSQNVAMRQVPFEEVVAIARKHDLPTIVDNAGGIPPKSMLTTFTRLGADLVIVSGGKALRAPNDTGFILAGGQRGLQLIEAIRLQSFPQIWGIGRAFKVSKEDIVGLVRAVELFVERDEDEAYASQMAMAQSIKSVLETVRDLDVVIVPNDGKIFEHPMMDKVPRVYLEWDAEVFGFDAQGLDHRMAADDPPISLRTPRLTQDNTTHSRSIRLIDPYMLRDDEATIVGERVKKAFVDGAAGTATRAS